MTYIKMALLGTVQCMTCIAISVVLQKSISPAFALGLLSTLSPPLCICVSVFICVGSKWSSGLPKITQQKLYADLGFWHFFAWHSDKKMTLIRMLGKYTVPLQCQVWQSYYNTDSWLLTLLCFLFPMLNKRIPVKKKQALQVSVGRMVLHSALWCSGLALGLIWRCQVGCWGWGSCRRQKQWGTWPHSQRKRHSHPQLLVCGDWTQKWPGGKSTSISVSKMCY